MGRKIDIDGTAARPEPDAGEPEFKFEDRRHWMRGDAAREEPADEAAGAPAPTAGELAALRARAEGAERKLQEYSEAFRTFRAEQDEVRQRLARDVDRRVDLRFAELLRDVVDTVDDLDLAMSWAVGVAEAAKLAEGVDLARKRFVAALERSGVERVVPTGAPFDPAEAEAVRVDAVEAPELDGTVTETLSAGYRLRDCLIRPARVAVGRTSASPAAE